jgi:hypothetical protein
LIVSGLLENVAGSSVSGNRKSNRTKIRSDVLAKLIQKNSRCIDCDELGTKKKQ